MSGLDSQQSAELPPEAKDVTLPGAPESKTVSIEACEEFGGVPLLFQPVLNRGTNFTIEERKQHHLEGLLPPKVETLEEQAERVMLQIRSESDPLEKYEILNGLQTTNETLFYYTLIQNFDELSSVIYTPTVGEACQKYDRIFRQPVGMYFSAFNQKGRFREILRNWPSHNVQIIVVTDGGRILGLGDLGTNGMGISVGKIALYVAGAGFHPDHSLPATLDMGTNNQELLDDKFYLGAKEKRLEGDEHMAVVEEFVMAVKKRHPHALIQFEDFQTDRAFAILERFRDKVLCFNDDIQGTGAVVTTGFINGLKAMKAEVKDARVVFYGAGSSAVGVAQMIATLLETEGGLSEEEARKRIYMVDSKGLVTTSRGDELPEHKKLMARSDEETPNMKDLAKIVAHVKPHALIGLTGGGPAWGQDVIEEMSKHVERPLIFPLSNPTDKAEITAENAYEWSKGKGVVASGSPFEPYEYKGKKLIPGQANNVFIFPAVLVKAKTIKDEMFIAAARALADYVTPEEIAAAKIYPELRELRQISAQVATAVAKSAFELGVAGIEKPKDLEAYIKSRMWLPGKVTHDPKNLDTEVTGHRIDQK
eukprot:jgi/Astpho2/944/Aster-00780